MRYINKLKELSPISEKYFSIYVSIIMRAKIDQELEKNV